LCCSKGSATGLNGGKGGVSNDRGKGMGFISHHEIEERLAGYGMRAVIVGKFGMREHFRPGCGITSTEYSEVGFNFLIYSLSFSIHLGVVGSGKGAYFRSFPSSQARRMKTRDLDQK
jgi:hypothetical protein